MTDGYPSTAARFHTSLLGAGPTALETLCRLRVDHVLGCPHALRHPFGIALYNQHDLFCVSNIFVWSISVPGDIIVQSRLVF